MNIIGKNIKKLRQAQGSNQATVAKELDISIPAYSKIETGITDPNFSRIQQIATYFNVDIESLIVDNGVEKPNPFSVQYFEALNELREAREKIETLQAKVISLYEKLDSK